MRCGGCVFRSEKPSKHRSEAGGRRTGVATVKANEVDAPAYRQRPTRPAKGREWVVHVHFKPSTPASEVEIGVSMASLSHKLA